VLRTAKVAEHLDVASVVEGFANGLVRFEVGPLQRFEPRSEARAGFSSSAALLNVAGIHYRRPIRLDFQIQGRN